MQVKRFRAPSMQEALAAVKRELGEEAVILKSEVLPRSGVFDLMRKDTVEVVAAIDTPVSKQNNAPIKESSTPIGHGSGYYTERFRQQSNQKSPDLISDPYPPLMNSTFSQILNQKIPGDKRTHPKTARSIKNNSGTRSHIAKLSKRKEKKHTDKKLSANEVQHLRRIERYAQLSTMTTKNEAFKQKESIDSLKAEVSKLQATVRAMSDQLGPINELSVREFADMPTPLAYEMLGLIESGVEKHLARELVEKATSSIPLESFHQKTVIRERLLQEMKKIIKTSGPISCRRGSSNVIALVGPTGVGKTTTLAKLAANSKFMFNKNVALISADTYRMSAIEHLNTFAGIAHLPLSAVYSPSELKAALSAHRDKDLVFIDTAGRSPMDEENLQELKKFMECAEPDEIHLVLPANVKSLDLIDTVRRFKHLPIDHIIISKIDETSTFGSVLNIAAEVESSISYITNGQTIPDDIQLANAHNLAKMILRAA